MIDPLAEIMTTDADSINIVSAESEMGVDDVTACAIINDSMPTVSPIFVGYDTNLSLNQQDIDILGDKTEDIERADFDGGDFDCSYKLCATRHGCSGATNCNACYGDYRR